MKRALARRDTRRDMHCHPLVRNTAIEMAHELYAKVMGGDNALYAQMKALCPELSPALLEIEFIELLYPVFVRDGSARATLAAVLASPAPEALKERVYDALIADATLTRGRQRGTTAP
jgi:hypothetical protein